MNTGFSHIEHDFSHQSYFDFSKGLLTHSENDLGLNWHNQTEIIHFIEGEGTFNVSGRSYRVRANSFIIINPNQIHSAIADFGRPLKYQTLKFKYDYFKTYDNDPVYLNYILPLSNGNSYLPSTVQPTFPIHKLITDLFDEIDDIMKSSNNTYELQIKMKMYKLIHILYSNKFVYKKTNPFKLQDAEMTTKKIISYVELHYQSDLSLDYLSNYLETSKPHMCRTFKRMTGETISNYYNNYKINRACDLLLNTDLSATSIAFKVGYNSISYFNQRFKAKTNLTPIEFREIQKKETQ